MKMLGRKSKQSEAAFQKALVERIQKIIPGCIVLKNDSGYLQGIPDLTVFYNDAYAILEVKESVTAPYRPNQEYYLKLFADWNVMSETVYPENVHEVLTKLQKYFGVIPL